MSKILVLDDSQTILKFVTETLTKAGHTVKTADNIWIAPLVTQFEPDLILIDVNISSSSKGTVAVEALKKLKIVQEHSIVLLHSSLPFEELEDLANSCGAEGYICKTDEPESLIQQVDQFLVKGKKNCSFAF